MSVFKYRMLVQARTDLTEDEIAQYQASGRGRNTPSAWPWRETGDILHARRRNTACAFYRALKRIPPIIKIRAVLINDDSLPTHELDVVLMRAWRGFDCLSGYVSHAGIDVSDEVKHFAVANGRSACGLEFQNHWTVHGKPECEICLAVAVNCHPEMKEFL